MALKIRRYRRFATVPANLKACLYNLTLGPGGGMWLLLNQSNHSKPTAFFLEEEKTGRNICIAFLDDAVIGWCCSFENGTGVGMFVDPLHRGKGVAQQLVQTWLKSHTLPEVRVYTHKAATVTRKAVAASKRPDVRVNHVIWFDRDYF